MLRSLIKRIEYADYQHLFYDDGFMQGRNGATTRLILDEDMLKVRKENDTTNCSQSEFDATRRE